jgi:hypothetical protein
VFDGGHQVQHRAAGIAREAVKQLPGRIDVERILSLAAMQWATPAPLIFPTAPQTADPIPLQHPHQRHSLFD